MMLVRFDAFKYSVKIWLSSAAVGPLLYFGLSNLLHCYDAEFLGDGFIKFLLNSYVVVVIIGALISSVIWLIFYLLIRLIVTAMFPQIKYIKLVVAIVGAILTFGAFVIIKIPILNLEAMCFIGAYASVITLGSFIYNLNIEYDVDV